MAIDDLAHETGLSHATVFIILHEKLWLTTLCIRTRIKTAVGGSPRVMSEKLFLHAF